MDLTNEKVLHKRFGKGIVVEHSGEYINVQFENRMTKFQYPSAFEEYLKMEDISVQGKINAEIDAIQRAEEERKRADEIARMETEELKKSLPQQKKKNTKDIDAMFSADYHVEYLSKHPILTYQAIEQEFGIKISGFGRGINPTATTVVLISSISKAKGKFVYHDHWTENGDYIYSGEGKNGDQKLTKGNKAIVDAKKDGKAIHLFVKLSPQEYYYQGIFSMVDYEYIDEKDETGSMRKEYKFKLRKANRGVAYD